MTFDKSPHCACLGFLIRRRTIATPSSQGCSGTNEIIHPKFLQQPLEVSWGTVNAN